MSGAEAGFVINNDNNFTLSQVDELATSTKTSTLDFSFGLGRDLIYSPLSTVYRERRILELDGMEDGALHCSLKTVKASDPGGYTALSYRWGDTIATRPITVNDAEYYTTSNLKNALEQLYCLGYRRVWTDALCINQNDNMEKGSQIGDMHNVYAEAEVVVAYIGDAVETEAEEVKTLVTAGYPFYKTRDSEAIRRFFDQPFWERMWIVQEVALARRVQLVYGGVTFTWDCAVEAFKSLTAERHAHARQVINIRVRSQREITLFDAIRLTHKSVATEQIDRIFALLGLSSDGQRLVRHADYSQHHNHVLTKMTVEMMGKEGSLDLICVGSFDNSTDNPCPSWVPNWFNLWTRSKTLIEQKILLSQRLGDFRQPSYKLSGGVLSVPGVILDEIEAVSKAVDPSVSKAKDANKSRDMTWQSRDMTWRGIREGGRWEIIRILCLDDIGANPGYFHSSGPRKYDEKEKKAYRACLAEVFVPDELRYGSNSKDSQIWTWLSQNQSFVWAIAMLIHSAEQAKSTPITSKLKMVFQKSDKDFTPAQLKIFTRRIGEVLESGLLPAITKSQRLGMVPTRTREGDKLCILKGCSTPIILRPRESPQGAFTVVGPTYFSANALKVKDKVPDKIHLY